MRAIDRTEDIASVLQPDRVLDLMRAAKALQRDNERLLAALKKIADDPCLDPEGNRQIAQRALDEPIPAAHTSPKPP